MQTRRPNYTHEFIGAEYRDELKFKPDPSIRAFIGKGDYSVILDGGSYPGTNHAANVAFKKIGEKERKSVLVLVLDVYIILNYNYMNILNVEPSCVAFLDFQTSLSFFLLSSV